MEFYKTFKTQVELLPRVTIIYGKSDENDISSNGFAIEWLWFGVFINFALSRNEGNTMLGDSTFNVYTITDPTETNNGYCHWSDGLKMYIKKDGKTITLNSDEIQKLVKSLPRTLGGRY